MADQVSGANNVKIASFFAIPAIVAFSATFAFHAHSSKHQALLPFLNCLAGGFILGFGVLHILPDAVEDYSASGLEDTTKQYPVVYAIMLWSFMFILLFEKSIIQYVEAHPALNKQATTSEMELTHSHDPERGHQSAFHSHAVPSYGKSTVSAYILMFGLSIHSIFEGLAIGLSTEAYGTLFIFIGVALHKFAEGFAFGMAMHNAGVRGWHAASLLAVFMLVVPIGVGIGMGVLAIADDTARAKAASILNAVASGVFLYISVLGIIVDEFADGKNIFAKGSLMLLALSLMGFISFFV